MGNNLRKILKSKNIITYLSDCKSRATELKPSKIKWEVLQFKNVFFCIKFQVTDVVINCILWRKTLTSLYIQSNWFLVSISSGTWWHHNQSHNPFLYSLYFHKTFYECFANEKQLLSATIQSLTWMEWTRTVILWGMFRVLAFELLW